MIYAYQLNQLVSLVKKINKIELFIVLINCTINKKGENIDIFSAITFLSFL